MATCVHDHTTMYMCTCIDVTLMGLRLMSTCYGHTLTLLHDDCTDNAARTKDKHQSDSEERHTRELHNYKAVPRLYLSTLYIVDMYMYIPAHL